MIPSRRTVSGAILQVPMINRPPIIVLVLIVLFFPCFIASAGQVIQIDSDAQFNYAETSYKEGLYLLAAAEYRRFAHFFPNDVRVPEAAYKIGLCLYNARHYRDAITEFNDVIGRFKDDPYAVKAQFKISDCHLQLGNTDQALLELKNLILVTNDSDVIDQVYYRSGWILMEKRQWEDSAQAFARIGEANRQRYDLDALSMALGQAKQIPHKDPTLAGVFSVVPGGGFLYCEEYRNALVSFLLNGLLILATVESFENDNVWLGGVLSVATFGFYAGNIYGGINSAHKYNRHEEHKFINRLQQDFKIQLSSNTSAPVGSARLSRGPAGEVDRWPSLILSFHCSF